MGPKPVQVLGFYLKMIQAKSVMRFSVNWLNLLFHILLIPL
jgi:hypothetical protein